MPAAAETAEVVEEVAEEEAVVGTEQAVEEAVETEPVVEVQQGVVVHLPRQEEEQAESNITVLRH